MPRGNFDIAATLRLQDRISERYLIATAYSVAGLFLLSFLCDITFPTLTELQRAYQKKKRYQVAARILLDYGKDVREAVIFLVQGTDLS